MRVDAEHRVCMVQPGVLFEELIPAEGKEDIRFNMPLLPRKTKTVIGRMVDREPVIMPKYHWYVSDPLACMQKLPIILNAMIRSKAVCYNVTVVVK